MKRRDFLASGGAAFGASMIGPATKVSAASGLLPAMQTAPGPRSQTLDDIHARMKSICKDRNGNGQVGAFFRISWLINNIQRDLTAAQALTQHMSYPTPFAKVNAGLWVDPTSVKLSLFQGTPQRTLLAGFAPAIVYKEPNGTGREYGRVTITFDDVHLKFEQDPARPGKLGFSLTTADPKSPEYPHFRSISPSVPTPENTQALKDNGITNADYKKAIDAVTYSTAPIDILNSFVGSLPLLGLVEAMHQFGITEPMQFHFEDDFVIIHGPAGLSTIDKCGPGVGTRVSPTSGLSAPAVTQSSNTDADPKNGFNVKFAHSIEAIDATPATGDAQFGYFYPIEWSFKDFGIGIVSPGVIASDQGESLPFRWEYFAGVRPIPQDVSVKMSSNQNPEVNIVITCPFDLGGTAGVSMKVGCVSVPLIRCSVIGHIRPSAFSIKLALANTSTGPAIITTAGYDCAVDVTFYDPPMLDILLNILLGSFGNRLIGNELRKMVNNLNFPLINLGGLSYITDRRAPWRLGQSSGPDSFLIGLEQDRG